MIEWTGVPYRMAPMRNPAKFVFSRMYSQDGICGAYGLLDQGGPQVSDMVRRVQPTGSINFCGGQEDNGLGAGWGVKGFDRLY